MLSSPNNITSICSSHRNSNNNKNNNGNLGSIPQRKGTTTTTEPPLPPPQSSTTSSKPKLSHHHHHYHRRRSWSCSSSSYSCCGCSSAAFFSSSSLWNIPNLLIWIMLNQVIALILFHHVQLLEYCTISSSLVLDVGGGEEGARGRTGKEVVEVDGGSRMISPFFFTMDNEKQQQQYQIKNNNNNSLSFTASIMKDEEEEEEMDKGIEMMDRMEDVAIKDTDAVATDTTTTSSTPKMISLPLNFPFVLPMTKDNENELEYGLDIRHLNITIWTNQIFDMNPTLNFVTRRIKNRGHITINVQRKLCSIYNSKSNNKKKKQQDEEEEEEENEEEENEEDLKEEENNQQQGRRIRRHLLVDDDRSHNMEHRVQCPTDERTCPSLMYDDTTGQCLQLPSSYPLDEEQYYQQQKRLRRQLHQDGLILFSNMAATAVGAASTTHHQHHHQQGRRPLNYKGTFVTIWDPILQTHVWLSNYYFMLKKCNGIESGEMAPCPKPCGGPYLPLVVEGEVVKAAVGAAGEKMEEDFTVNTTKMNNNNISTKKHSTTEVDVDNNKYPLYFDRSDKLCKSSHPTVLSSKMRPYTGPCDCFATCYTPAATIYGSVWPWPNETIRNEYYDYYTKYNELLSAPLPSSSKEDKEEPPSSPNEKEEEEEKEDHDNQNKEENDEGGEEEGEEEEDDNDGSGEEEEEEEEDAESGEDDEYEDLDHFAFRQKTKHKGHQRSCLKKRWTGMKPKQYYRESTACEHVHFIQQERQRRKRKIIAEQNITTNTVNTMSKKGLNHRQQSSHKDNKNMVTTKDVEKANYDQDEDLDIGTNNFTLPCPAHAAGLHHLYFIPEAKLIFCGIPKVGISEWIKFFRYTWGAGDYLSLPHFKTDKEEFHLSSLPHAKADALLKDPTWTKAVIFRDPAERLLSAYLDKVVKHAFTQKYFHIGSLKDKPRTMLSFSEFVDLISVNNTNCNDKRGVHYCIDPHWRPQLVTCGLDSILPLFDFIGSFSHLPEHSRLLLERVGLWDKYGATFDDTTATTVGENKLCEMPPPPSRRNESNAYSDGDAPPTIWGFNQRPPQGNHHSREHETGSRNKMDVYYTPELLAKVRTAYAMDYEVWDEIKDRPPLDVVAGYDMLHVNEACGAGS